MVSLSHNGAWQMITAAGMLIALGSCSGFAPQPCPQITAVTAAGSPAEIAALQCAAGRGSKSAQLALGIRYEEGTGVPKDYWKAAKLYRQAATSTPNTTYVYSPPVGKEKVGRVIPVNIGTAEPGLAEAAFRLARLQRPK
jgi:hypothetical protein